MKQIDLKLVARIIICFVILAGMTTGCSSTKGLLGFLKFWGPKDETATDEKAAAQASAFMLQVRPARGNPDSHYRLAVHYQLRGRHQEAIEEFTKTVMIDPGYVFAYNGMGVSYDNLKEFDRAAEAYRTAMRLAPGEHYAYNNLGYSLILKGDYEGAVKILQEGIALTENNEQMHNNLAIAYAALGEKDLAITELRLAHTTEGIPTALEQIQQQLDGLEAKTFSAAAPGEISSEDLAPVRAKNRFVEKMTRSIKEAKKARAKTRTAKPVNLEAAKLEPDFLKMVPTGGNKEFDRKTTPKETADLSAKFVRELLVIRHTGDSVPMDHLAGRKQWF